MNKRSTQQDVTIANVYALSAKEPSYLKQTVLYLKEDINSNIIKTEEFNIPLSSR